MSKHHEKHGAPRMNNTANETCLKAMYKFRKEHVGFLQKQVVRKVARLLLKKTSVCRFEEFFLKELVFIKKGLTNSAITKNVLFKQLHGLQKTTTTSR